MRFPRTQSQNWAKSHGACWSGRRRLGKRSLGAYWVKCPDAQLRDLLWAVQRLRVSFIHGEHEEDRSARQFNFDVAATRAYHRANRGRWKGQHVRSALDGVMSEFNVRLPMWLL